MKSLYVFLTGRRFIARTPRGGQVRIGTKSARARGGSRRPPRIGSTSGGGWLSPHPGWGCGGLPAGESRVESQVRLEPVPAAFAAEAGLLVPAERRRRVEAVERVRPDHT